MKISSRSLACSAVVLGAAATLAAPAGAVAVTPHATTNIKTTTAAVTTIAKPVTVYEVTKPDTHTSLLTTDANEVISAAKYGYTLNLGAVFVASSAPQTGFTAVHRLFNAGHGFVFIPEGGEMNNAISKYGYTDQGIEFYASLSPATELEPVYRIATPEARFTYTTDKSVRDADVAQSGWKEGFAAFYVQPVSVASTSDPNTFWAAPDGVGTGLTKSSPTNLAIAQKLAEARMKMATTDVNIILEDGTYRLDTPTILTGADSGINGHTMRYRAADGAHPVISGAHQITGWQAVSGKSGVYRASVAKGLMTRNFSVNGVPAQRAFGDGASILGTVTRTDAGFVTSKDISGWANPTDVEFVWTGASKNAMTSDIQTYLEPRCDVASVTKNANGGDTITMDQPCFGKAVSLSVNVPTTIENNLNLLTKQGQFYVDSAAGYVYYMPRSGENVATMDAELAVSDGLVRANGVSNLSISGITFSDDTWLKPSTMAGYPEIANTKFYDPDAPAGEDRTLVPGAIQFKNSSGISLDHVTVTRTGGAGIQFDNTTHDSSVTHSTITQTSGHGIEAGGLYSTDSYTASGITIQNNTINHVGTVYHGGSGVFFGWIKNSTIDHNDIGYTAYSGISMGTDWDQDWDNYGGNKITWNNVHSVMQTPNLWDGGGIYTNLPCADMNRCAIANNVVNDDQQRYAALYLDNAGRSTDVTNNVVSNIGSDTWWILAASFETFNSTHIGQNSNISGNWIDTSATKGGNIGPDSNNKASNNMTGISTANWPVEAQKVIYGVGPTN